MAKRKNTSALPEFREVIQVSLLPDMMHKVEALVAKEDHVLAQVVDLANNGYVVSLSPNPFGGVTVAIRCAEPLSTNAGLQFYSNAPTAEEACAVALVKLDFLEQASDWKMAEGVNESSRYR